MKAMKEIPRKAHAILKLINQLNNINRNKQIGMQFIQEHKIDQTLLENLRNAVNGQKNLQPSQIYNSLTNEKLVDTNLRLSRFQTLVDDDIFDLAEKVVDMINSEHQSKKFCLYRNDIMHIKYDAGGYFKSHEDYLSLTSNFVEEYSLIICITREGCQCQGGETLLHLNKYFTHVSKASITPGGCLLFRKDINHEGLVVKSGEKEILTFNVWGVNNDVDGILMVRFENDDRKYLISINDIIAINATDQKNLLQIYLESQFAKVTMGNKILVYDAKCSYTEFSVIYKITSGMVLSYDELSEYSHIIDYYLFPINQLLVKTIDSSLNQNKYMSKHLISENGDLILTGNQLTYIQFVETIKEKKLPYVPFKILFGEGLLTYGGGMSGTKPTKLPMSPLCLTFSEANNIMLLYNPLSSSSSIVDQDLYQNMSFEDQLGLQNQQQKNKFENILPGQMVTLLYDEDEELEQLEENVILYKFDDLFEFNDEVLNINLACCGPFSAIVDRKETQSLLKMVTSGRLSQINVKKSTNEGGNLGQFYSIDENNQLIIFPNHFKCIIDRVTEYKNFDQSGQSLRFYDYIISQINNIDFIISQKMNVIEEQFYCNENVYGNFNLLMVYGALKLD